MGVSGRGQLGGECPELRGVNTDIEDTKQHSHAIKGKSTRIAVRRKSQSDLSDSHRVHHHWLDWLVVAVATDVPDGENNVHAIDHLAEHGVLRRGRLVEPVEERVVDLVSWQVSEKVKRK